MGEKRRYLPDVSALVGPFGERPRTALYHYSGVSGLLGIVESRSLWCSHVYYLNDSAEVKHGADVLATVVREDLAVNSPRVPPGFFDELLKWLGSFRFPNTPVFIFSFSEEATLLSQWRAYTPFGNGVSIGFSQARVEAILAANPGWLVAKCRYDLSEHRAIAKLLSNSMCEQYVLWSADTQWRGPVHPSQKYLYFFESFKGIAVQLFALLKDGSFREEREWRLISPYIENYAEAPIEFRAGSSMLIPYMTLQLGDQVEGEGLFCEVLLGPSSSMNLSMNALSMFLSRKRACSSVTNPCVPYREWTRAK